MKKQIEQVIEFIKQQPIKGCLTGSALLNYFEGQDVDVFCYTKSSFTKLYYILAHNPMFTILDAQELWKAEEFEEDLDMFSKSPITTIKFMYNTCIPVNIVLKKGATDLYAVLSSFDMDIISKGYDIQTKQTLDLTGNSTVTKIASWNVHNTNFYNPKLWQMRRILRQLTRVFKYYKRGYNTDLVVLKYIELINKIQDYQNIFSSESFAESLELSKQNTKLVKKICELWLETHEISEETIELINVKMREI